jgi:hypothetical protein
MVIFAFIHLYMRALRAALSAGCIHPAGSGETSEARTHTCVRREMWTGVIVLAHLAQLSTCHAFGVLPAAQRLSAAAPRFDAFCEQIVGRWVQPPETGGASFDVTEVMRSCGGAVQGVKELGVEGGIYHNRADDGFIYFACGSYSAGPLTLEQDGELVSSLSFPSCGFRRLVRLPGTVARERGNDKPSRTRACLWRGEAEAGTAPPPDTPTSLQLKRELGCWSRAGSPFQLARVRWQRQELEQLGSAPAWPASPDVEWDEDGTTWVARSQSAAALSAWDFSDGEEEGTVVQVGGLCWNSREAKAITRRFCPAGRLQAVILSEGSF